MWALVGLLPGVGSFVSLQLSRSHERLAAQVAGVAAWGRPTSTVDRKQGGFDSQALLTGERPLHGVVLVVVIVVLTVVLPLQNTQHT